MPAIGIGLATLLAGGIGTAGGLAAAKMGSNTQKSVASQQQSMADAATARAKPAYDSAFNYYQGLMNAPLTSPGVADTQLQFDAARKNLVNGAQSRGGGLDAGLANVEAGRAMTMSNLIAGGRQNAAAGLTGLATGNQNAALSALASAQSSQTQNAMLSQQALGGIGSFLTRLLSTPGLFGSGGNANNNAYNNLPQSAPMIPGAVTSNHSMFDPAGQQSPFISGQEMNYFPGLRG